MIDINQATSDDLDRLVPLFDGYRQFYRQTSDLPAARAFLMDRFKRSESVIFIATRENDAVGFTQLYPSFSSISLAPIYVLSDLFVAQNARRQGTGRQLLEAAADFGRFVGASQLTLETAKMNTTAQTLYEACGWLRDNEFYVYQITLTPTR